MPLRGKQPHERVCEANWRRSLCAAKRPRTPDVFNGCFVGAAYMPPATYRGNPSTGNHPPTAKGEGCRPPLPLSSATHLWHPVGAGHARPATSPPPAVNLPPPTHSPKPPDPATLLPPNPIICARQPPSPQYTPCPNFTLKLCRKNQKNLQKPVDKGHTTCYNNQAVSRAQPAAAAAGAFTYSLYAVF